MNDLVDADRPQDLRVIVGQRLDAGVGNSEFDQVQRDQRDDVHALTETDDGDIDLVESERLERAFVGRVGKDRLSRELRRILNGLFVVVDRDDLGARLKKRPRRGRSEMSDADNCESFHKVLILKVQESRFRT